MSVKKKQYTTLSSYNSDEARVYHDRDSLPFEAKYPLVEFNDDTINEHEDRKKLEKYLVHNFWYQKANSIKREQMLDRTAHINNNLGIILDFFKQKYGHLGIECLHISIAGSYAHASNPGDIDLDVIVSGSFFDYSYFNEGVEVLDLTDSISKVSLTVMGEDNVLGKKQVASTIENQGFIHQDTILREMLVAPMRNITIYGKVFDYQKAVDSYNVLVRIARQLYFASLTLKGKIPYYNEDPLKTKKALKRIDEAHDILEWLLFHTPPSK